VLLPACLRYIGAKLEGCCDMKVLGFVACANSPIWFVWFVMYCVYWKGVCFLGVNVGVLLVGVIDWLWGP
jgi:hypothetical protein